MSYAPCITRMADWEDVAVRAWGQASANFEEALIFVLLKPADRDKWCLKFAILMKVSVAPVMPSR